MSCTVQCISYHLGSQRHDWAGRGDRQAPDRVSPEKIHEFTSKQEWQNTFPQHLTKCKEIQQRLQLHQASASCTRQRYTTTKKKLSITSSSSQLHTLCSRLPRRIRDTVQHTQQPQTHTETELLICRVLGAGRAETVDSCGFLPIGQSVDGSSKWAWPQSGSGLRMGVAPQWAELAWFRRGRRHCPNPRATRGKVEVPRWPAVEHKPPRHLK